tara:strand:- start:2394 stop:3260 length:867 start_codon:yes stop_codon:yes gene_type:complete
MKESKNIFLRTSKAGRRRSSWAPVIFEECQKGQTAAKTGCTPQSGEGGKEGQVSSEKSPFEIGGASVGSAFDDLTKAEEKLDEMKSGEAESTPNMISEAEDEVKQAEAALDKAQQEEIDAQKKEKKAGEGSTGEGEKGEQKKKESPKTKEAAAKEIRDKVEKAKKSGVKELNLSINDVDRMLEWMGMPAREEKGMDVRREKEEKKEEEKEKKLSPQDKKEAARIGRRVKRSEKKIESLEKSREEMVGKGLKGRPQKEIDSYNKEVDLEIEKHKKLIDISNNHLDKYYR